MSIHPGWGMEIHNCNPTLRRLRKEDQEFKANLGYSAILKPDV
jgi:hypothetical protein